MMFRTHYSGSLNGGMTGHLEMGPWKSQTIPDQTMSIAEMLERARNGLTIGDGKIPLYESDDPDLARSVPVDWDKWDFAEREDWIMEQVTIMRGIRAKHSEKERSDFVEKLRKEEREKLLAEIQKEKKDATQDPPKPPVP